MPLYRQIRCEYCFYLGSFTRRDYYYCKKIGVLVEIRETNSGLREEYISPSQIKKYPYRFWLAYLMAKHRGFI